MKSLACLAILLGISLNAQAAPDECRLALGDKEDPANYSWKGPCKDGWADGTGVLEKRGEGKLGWRYEGGVQRGRPHGHGYMKTGDGRQYEGEYVNGHLEGLGIFVSTIGDRYDGPFKHGRREGRGSMSYKLGGRYDGDWKDDKYNGLGLVQYAGGRKLQTTFVDGLPVGQAPVTRTDGQVYKQLDDRAPTGSLLRTSFASSDVPLDKSYEQMTEGERNNLKARYPLMDEADEPPFPLRGMAELNRTLQQIINKTGSSGELYMIVMIDSDGKATEAKIYASPDAELGKYAAQAFMLQKYKPASCAGKPCAMAFPVRMTFTLRH